MYREATIEALIRATWLVRDSLCGELSIEDFAKEYGGFYYYEALDGHEAVGEQEHILEELRAVIAFHEKVQCEVVDLVYLGEDEYSQQHYDAGRISREDAGTRLRQLARRHDLDSILAFLKRSRDPNTDHDAPRQ